MKNDEQKSYVELKGELEEQVYVTKDQSSYLQLLCFVNMMCTL